MKQIIAMGGGGFSMEEEDSLLDKYIIEQSGKKDPEICFIPTASGDSETYIEKFHERLGRLGAKTSHLSLFRQEVEDLKEFILSKDIIYVGGGNTRNLLCLWKLWGLDRIMKMAWNRGILLCGISAGANCWFEMGSTDSWAGGLRAIECLGFLPGSFCPHFDSEPERPPWLINAIAEGVIEAGYGVEDGCALHFTDWELTRAISVKHGKGVTYFSPSGTDISAVPINVEYLQDRLLQAKETV